MVMEKSILVLVSCSNHKLRGGIERYDSKNTVGNSLASEARGYLLESRKAAIDHIRRGGFTRHGKRIIDLPYNADLRMSADFGGNEKGIFLSAHERYAGRLYKEISDDSWSTRSQDVLVLSGLYGLLTPEEPIQRYSLHLADSRMISDIWEGGLTLVLGEYVRKKRIAIVVDCLAEDLYRNVIDWTYLKEFVEIFHAFGDQNAGPSVLTAIGYFLARAGLASNEKDLLSILNNERGYATPYEKLCFLKDREDAARLGLPLEDEDSFRANERKRVPLAEKPSEIVEIDKGHGIDIKFAYKVLEQWKELPGEVRGKVLRILTQFALNPGHPGVRAEIIKKGGETFFRICIDRAYRIHLEIEGKALTIRAIGPHRLEGID